MAEPLELYVSVYDDGQIGRNYPTQEAAAHAAGPIAPHRIARMVEDVNFGTPSQTLPADHVSPREIDELALEALPGDALAPAAARQVFRAGALAVLQLQWRKAHERGAGS